MLIAIPSSRRTYRQITLANFRSLKMLENIVLVVPHDEFKSYQHEHSDRVRVFETPPGCAGISQTREWILTLPDKFGKVKLPEPTAADRRLVERACAGTPYTTAVKRAWEK